MVLTLKGLLFLIAAIIFGIIGVYGALPPRSDWPRGVASIGWCLAMIASFLWTAGR